MFETRSHIQLLRSAGLSVTGGHDKVVESTHSHSGPAQPMSPRQRKGLQVGSGVGVTTSWRPGRRGPTSGTTTFLAAGLPLGYCVCG